MKVYVRKLEYQGRILRALSPSLRPPPSMQMTRGSRAWHETVGAGWRLPFGRSSQILRTMLGLVTIILAAFGIGYGAGKLLHDPQAAAMAHASGACIALEMAAAHGAIDEVQRRMTLRALVSVLNPHFERFPEQATDITGTCDRLTKGAVSGKVARW